MKGKKHSPEQIINKLREAEAMIVTRKTIGPVLQALEVSEQKFHRWRNQYRTPLEFASQRAASAPASLRRVLAH